MDEPAPVVLVAHMVQIAIGIVELFLYRDRGFPHSHVPTQLRIFRNWAVTEGTYKTAHFEPATARKKS